MKMEGYFTVEAALVFPMVLAEIVLVIYLLIFQYDRCLMEQDLGVLALRGMVLQAEDNQDRIQELERQEQSMDTQKYLAWERGELEMKIERGILHVERSGRMEAMNASWESTRDYESHMISPVLLIRSYRRWKGGR